MGISEMKETTDWEELRLFLAVARSEGLAGGARQIGLSAPTLGRRMNELERRLDRRLFERSQTGYALTDDGRELYRQALEMELAAGSIERWRVRNARRVVRISAGSWTSRFIARNVVALWQGDDDIGIELVTTHARVDIGHRRADIGVRNRATDDPRLAGRRLQDVAHCVYRGRSAADAELPWVGVSGDAAITQSARWVSARTLDGAVFVCSDARVVLDLVRSGAAQAVLPCFVGDVEEALVRAGEPVAELRGEQWLALNDQARRELPVRKVIDRLAALLEAHRALFEGERPRS